MNKVGISFPFPISLDGTTFASSHALLSCNHGCRIAWFAKDVAECKAHCTAGNAGGCSYDGSLETGTLHKCNNCQEGCARSTSRDECAAGCDNAFAVNDLGLGPAMTFYNDLKYTSPPSPRPKRQRSSDGESAPRLVTLRETTVPPAKGPPLG